MRFAVRGRIQGLDVERAVVARADIDEPRRAPQPAMKLPWFFGRVTLPTPKELRAYRARLAKHKLKRKKRAEALARRAAAEEAASIVAALTTRAVIDAVKDVFPDAIFNSDALIAAAKLAAALRREIKPYYEPPEDCDAAEEEEHDVGDDVPLAGGVIHATATEFASLLRTHIRSKTGMLGDLFAYVFDADEAGRMELLACNDTSYTAFFSAEGDWPAKGRVASMWDTFQTVERQAFETVRGVPTTATRIAGQAAFPLVTMPHLASHFFPGAMYTRQVGGTSDHFLVQLLEVQAYIQDREISGAFHDVMHKAPPHGSRTVVVFVESIVSQTPVMRLLDELGIDVCSMGLHNNMVMWRNSAADGEREGVHSEFPSVGSAFTTNMNSTDLHRFEDLLCTVREEQVAGSPLAHAYKLRRMSRPGHWSFRVGVCMRIPTNWGMSMPAAVPSLEASPTTGYPTGVLAVEVNADKSLLQLLLNERLHDTKNLLIPLVEIGMNLRTQLERIEDPMRSSLQAELDVLDSLINIIHSYISASLTSLQDLPRDLVCDFPGLVERIVHPFRRLLDLKVDVDEFLSDLAPVSCKVQLVERVLLNALTNTVRHGHSETLKSALTEPLAKVTIELTPVFADGSDTPSQILLKYFDNGPGYTKEFVKDVNSWASDPLTLLLEASSKSGMVQVCGDLAMWDGARLRFKRKNRVYGKGAVMFVNIPLAETPVGLIPDTEFGVAWHSRELLERGIEQLAGMNPVCFVVDDESIALSVNIARLKATLSDLNLDFQIHRFQDPREAVKAARSLRRTDVHQGLLLFTDKRMEEYGGMDGVELARVVSGILPRVISVLISATLTPAELSTQAGARGTMAASTTASVVRQRPVAAAVDPVSLIDIFARKPLHDDTIRQALALLLVRQGLLEPPQAPAEALMSPQAGLLGPTTISLALPPPPR